MIFGFFSCNLITSNLSMASDRSFLFLDGVFSRNVVLVTPVGDLCNCSMLLDNTTDGEEDLELSVNELASDTPLKQNIPYIYNQIINKNECLPAIISRCLSVGIHYWQLLWLIICDIL